MISGDYVERTRKTKSGKLVVDKIVTSTTGVEYAIGKKLGAGGVAKVYRARRLNDKKECVFKEYIHSPETRKIHNAIKRNIQNLIRNPLTEDDGITPLKSFVGPMDKDSLIELPESNGFGYIMELVDTKKFLPVPRLWHRDAYPDAEILCKVCINISYFFRRVHFKGWCYKDINEGNIYINNKNGEVRIIDCDNISVQSTKTIRGTDGFMAPEVYVTSTPDIYTDYFSMAVLFYRLFIGGFPMDGKKTRQYLLSNNLSVSEAASTIYGSMAVFAFDPQDHSNEIRQLKDPLNPAIYEIQTKRWDRLPLEIQDCFIQTFSTGLANENRNKRATDRDWMKMFKELEKNRLVKCRCGKVGFGDKQEEKECFFCKAKLDLIKPTVKGNELTTAVLKVRRDISPTRLEIIVKRKQQLQGKAVYPALNEGWMRIEYSKSRNMLSAVNLSTFVWTVSDQGIKKECVPGGRVILKKGIVITILKRQLQLTVTEVK